MDASTLAAQMLDWESRKRELDKLESEIAATVLEIGKTQTVGNVRATYSAGRRTFDYETAAVEHPMVSEATISLFTETKVITDWKKICDHAGIDEVPVLKQTEPSVSVKLLG